jgi:hypothetical protein
MACSRCHHDHPPQAFRLEWGTPVNVVSSRRSYEELEADNDRLNVASKGAFSRSRDQRRRRGL